LNQDQLKDLIDTFIFLLELETELKDIEKDHRTNIKSQSLISVELEKDQSSLIENNVQKKLAK
jgi:hypothetical protein